MELECPKCKKQFDYPRKPTLGIPDDHNDYTCPDQNCKQVLIWDYPQVHDAPGGRFSEPKECHHVKLKKAGAMVPTRIGA